MVHNNRRQFLKASAIGVGAIVGLSGTTVADGRSEGEETKWKTADDNWDWEEFEASLEKEYNQSEANVATNFAKQQVRKVENGKPRKDALEDLRKRLIKHPVTDDIEEDIKSVKKAHREHKRSVVSEKAATDEGVDK